MKKIKVTLLVLAAAASMNLLAACKSGSVSEPSATEAESGSQAQWKTDVELSDVLEAVKQAYGDDYIPSIDYDAQAMKDLFGVGEEQYEDFFAQGPMISIHVDTLIGVRAKEGQADAVEQALLDYRKTLVEDSVQYPMNMVKVNASEVVRYGDYIFFVMLGSPDLEAEEKGEEEALESAKENNRIGVDAIEGCFRV